MLLEEREGLLPLKKTLRSIAVIGPNADDSPRNQLGDYVPLAIPQHVVTVLEGIKQVVSPGTKVTYVKGCDVTGPAPNEIAKAAQAAAEADVAVVVVGERLSSGEGAKRHPTDGEGSRLGDAGIDRPAGGPGQGRQRHRHADGGRADQRPSAGHALDRPARPRDRRSLAARRTGGQAVAEILFGDVNPSGKLPVTVPRHAGQLPVYYNFKKSKRYWTRQGWGHAYVDMDPTPLYPFGHGLSYTRFDYSGLAA